MSQLPSHADEGASLEVGGGSLAAIQRLTISAMVALGSLGNRAL